MVQGGWGSSAKTVTVGQKPLHPGHRVYGKTCWLIAWKESGALMYSTALSVCMQAHLSLRLPDLNGSTVCDHSDEGWRETDNSMEDTIRLDSAIPGMQWSMQLCQPPPTPTPPHPILTQRAKWAHWLEGPSGMVERVSRGSVFPCGSSLWCGRASEKRRIPVKVIRQGSGQETFIALCVRNIVSCQVVFFFPSFFFLCVLCLNRGSICVSAFIY